MPYLLAMLLAALAAGIATPVLRTVARQFGVIDAPSPRVAHKIHTTPTPLLGGAGVYAAVLFTVLVSPQHGHAGVLALMVPATLMLGLGAAHDVRPLRLWLRLAAQAAIIILAVSLGLRAHAFGPLWLNVAVSLVWLAALTNAFNMLDNLDGLAPGAALLAALVLFYGGIAAGDDFIAALAAIAAGACLGFIGFSAHPASIFLGDGGALFLGFMVGGVCLLGPWSAAPGPAYWVLPLLACALPILNGFVELGRVPGGLTHAQLRRGYRLTTNLSLQYGVGLVGALAAGAALALPGWLALVPFFLAVAALALYTRFVLKEAAGE